MKVDKLGMNIKVGDENRLTLSDNFLESLDGIVTIVDLNNVFQYTNLPDSNDFQKIFKFNNEGKLTTDSHIPKITKLINNIFSITKKEKTWNGERTFVTKQRKIIKLFIQTNLLYDSESNPTSIISFCSYNIDIEKTKINLEIANDNLFAQKKIYSTLYNKLLYADGQLLKEKEKTEHVKNTIKCILSSVPNSVAVFRNRLIINANQIFCDLLGYTKEELINRSSRVIYQNQEDFDYVEEVLYNQLKTKDIASGELRWMKKNGETFLVNVKTSKIDTDNPEKGVIITAIEIDNINDKDSIIIESEKSYRDLFDCVSDTIYVLNKEGDFVSVNNAAVEMYGYPKEYFIGKSPVDLSAPDINDMELVADSLSKAYHGEMKQFRFWGKRANGEIFPKDVRVSRGRYFGKDVIYALATDISKTVLYEQELKQAKEKAEESDKLKSLFLENISHEIRTPMNGILGFADLLRDVSIPETKRTNYLDVIERSGDRMLNIIEDIVNISKIESGHISLYYSKFDLIDLLEMLYNIYVPEAQKKELELSLFVDLTEEERLIYSDKEKLVIILTNVIKNAIKYSDNGLVMIKCSIKDDNYLFSINDNGIGIPKDKTEDIFIRFYQVEDNKNGARQGSGLGLSIAKAFVEMLNGKIWLNSTLGKGSSFFISLPKENAIEL